jgi:hypothetical protein
MLKQRLEDIADQLEQSLTDDFVPVGELVEDLRLIAGELSSVGRPFSREFQQYLERRTTNIIPLETPFLEYLRKNAEKGE